MAFREILGQHLALKILQKDLTGKNLSGGYLFTGPSGVGKKMAAISFAKILNCREERMDSCERCSSCLRIERMNHPNLRIISPEGDSLKISQIRQLKKEAGYGIYEGKKRVWVLDEAEKLTLEAANSLLKILEEPPDDLIIILITPIPRLLPSTIISRCRTIQFLPLKSQDLCRLLKRRNDVPSHLIPLISELAQGSMSEALKLAKEEEIFREREEIFRLIQEGISISRKIFNLSQRWSTWQNFRLETFLNMILFFLRDLLLLKLASSPPLINQDKKDELLNLRNNYSFTQLYRGIEAVEQVKIFLQANVSTQLALEWMWMRIIYPESV
jgi:DNA polymerase-3 subunit delta'